MSDIIAVVTSTPSSAHNAEAALLSILCQSMQPSSFRWHLPKYCRRTQQVYGHIPRWVRNHPKIQVVECEDDGPLTKFTPIIDDIGDKRLVILDDDVIYHPDTIKILHEAQQAMPNSVVGTIGHTFTYVPFLTSKRKALGNHYGIRWFNRVSVLLGTGMILTPAGFFGRTRRQDILDIVAITPGLALNDDHLLAHVAFASQTPMFVITCPSPFPYVDNQFRLTGTNGTRNLELQMFVRRQLALPAAEIVGVLVIAFLLVKFYKPAGRQTLNWPTPPTIPY
jgi:hypothetical protein